MDGVGAGGEEALAQLLRAGRRTTLGQHDELVAAQAADRVDGPHRGGEALGDRLQQEIAHPVAVGVVDVLEAVEVDEEHRHRVTARARPLEGLGGALEDERPVGEPGQRVVEGEVPELAGLLLHQRQGDRARVGQRPDQQDEQGGQHQPDEEHDGPLLVRRRAAAQGAGQGEDPVPLGAQRIGVRDIARLRRAVAGEDLEVAVGQAVGQDVGHVRLGAGDGGEEVVTVEDAAHPSEELRRRRLLSGGGGRGRGVDGLEHLDGRQVAQHLDDDRPGGGVLPEHRLEHRGEGAHGQRAGRRGLMEGAGRRSGALVDPGVEEAGELGLEEQQRVDVHLGPDGELDGGQAHQAVLRPGPRRLELEAAGGRQPEGGIGLRHGGEVRELRRGHGLDVGEGERAGVAVDGVEGGEEPAELGVGGGGVGSDQGPGGGHGVSVALQGHVQGPRRPRGGGVERPLVLGPEGVAPRVGGGERPEDPDHQQGDGQEHRDDAPLPLRHRRPAARRPGVRGPGVARRHAPVLVPRCTARHPSLPASSPSGPCHPAALTPALPAGLPTVWRSPPRRAFPPVSAPCAAVRCCPCRCRHLRPCRRSPSPPLQAPSTLLPVVPAAPSVRRPSGRRLVELRQVCLTQSDQRRPAILLHMVDRRGPGDREDHRRPVQQPGEGDLG